jgi:hypothetical protein
MDAARDSEEIRRKAFTELIDHRTGPDLLCPPFRPSNQIRGLKQSDDRAIIGRQYFRERAFPFLSPSHSLSRPLATHLEGSG